MRTGRRNLIFLICLVCLPVAVVAQSLLTPTTFPKTVQDLNFADRVKLKQEGYVPFEGVDPYDALIIMRNDMAVDEEREQELATSPETTQPSNEYTPPTPPSPPSPPGTDDRVCQNINTKIPANQKIPLGEPIPNYNYDRVCSPYGPRGTYKDGSSYIHKGIDIGCGEKYYNLPVFVTADGVIESVIRWDPNAENFDPAGNHIQIKHDNGFSTVYMHLDEDMLLSKKDVGKKVKAGCQIANIGYTGGNALKKTRITKSGSHLHYEIHYTGPTVQKNGKKYYDLNGTLLELTYGRELNPNPKYYRNWSVNPIPFIKAGQ